MTKRAITRPVLAPIPVPTPTISRLIERPVFVASPMFVIGV